MRDGDTVAVDLVVKNPAGERLSYVNVTDTPSYPQSDHAFEPIEFPHIYYGNIVPPVANTEYDSRQLRTSETTGIGYYGFDIEAGATATFTLNIKAGSLAKGTYNWNLQLGLKRYDYVKESEYEWPCVGTEVEEVYAQIPIKVIVFAQPDASLVVGENTGTEYSPVINQSAVIDFGTVDLAATDENGLKAARTIWAYNNSPAIATDSHGNTTSITVNFMGESDSIEASPFSWGNIYSGYQLYLYDTKWSPLPPAGLSGGGTSYASYSCVLDATYLIAGTYTGSFVVGRTPTTLKVNGTAIDASTIYRIPVTVTLTGTNPRLLPRATNLTATPGNGQVELAWTPAEGSSEYTEYTIYRRVGAETQADADKLDWSLYEEVGTKRVGYDADGMLWVDGEVENGVTYSYTVMCGTPKCGYASAAVTATPVASIQRRMLAPQSYASGALNAVEVMWVMNEKYGGRDFDGSGMVDHFNVYRDGVLVDQVYQSAVEDDVSYGRHDDGTGTDTQVYGITGHS